MEKKQVSKKKVQLATVSSIKLNTFHIVIEIHLTNGAHQTKSIDIESYKYTHNQCVCKFPSIRIHIHIQL